MAQSAPSVRELPQRLWPGPSGQAAEEQHLRSSLAAVQALANVIRPCYGPYGLQKLLVTAKGETVFTGYATAILGALQLQHPAARLLREAALGQAEHSGDGVAFVVLLAEALLTQAELLLSAGLPRSQLREAYAAAAAETLALLPSLAIRSLGPLEDPSRALYAVMNTHSLSQAEYLAGLVAQVCWAARDLDGTFRRERVGVCVLQGGQLEESCLLPGLAVPGKPCGQVTVVLRGARVAVFACPFGLPSPNAPAKARLSGPAELIQFRKGSESLFQRQVAQLANAGVNVAVVCGEVEEKPLAQADKFNIMVIQVKSPRELASLSEVLGTPVMHHLVAPLEPGMCQRVYGQELREGLAVVFEWDPPATPALSVVLRGPTRAGLREAEQAVYHGIDAYFQLCQDPRLLPGAGATEMALAKTLSDRGTALEGLRGPVLLAFAQALRSLPATLAENAGLAASRVMADVSAAHQAGYFLAGVGVEGMIDAAGEEVWDTLGAKAQGIQAVADVVLELVTVDEIVMAKDSAPSRQDLSPNDKKAKDRHPSPVEIHK